MKGPEKKGILSRLINYVSPEASIVAGIGMASLLAIPLLPTINLAIENARTQIVQIAKNVVEGQSAPPAPLEPTSKAQKTQLKPTSTAQRTLPKYLPPTDEEMDEYERTGEPIRRQPTAEQQEWFINYEFERVRNFAAKLEQTYDDLDREQIALIRRFDAMTLPLDDPKNTPTLDWIPVHHALVTGDNGPAEAIAGIAAKKDHLRRAMLWIDGEILKMQEKVQQCR